MEKIKDKLEPAGPLSLCYHMQPQTPSGMAAAPHQAGHSNSPSLP